MNLILCSEPCIHQQDGCCGLNGAGLITNAALSPCRYFSPKDIESYEKKDFSDNEKKSDTSY